MTRITLLGLCVFGVILAGCTGGSAGDPDDDLSDLIVVSQSPGNGQELNMVDSLDGFNALNNPTLTNPSAVTIVFSTSLDPTSVINTDPTDPQGSRNVRLFYFDVDQGAFDPQNTDPTNEPPGANVLIQADTVLSFTNQPNDTIIIRPTGITPGNPFSPGNPIRMSFSVNALLFRYFGVFPAKNSAPVRKFTPNAATDSRMSVSTVDAQRSR